MMNSLAPGYRFYPTEEELISFYLRKKLERRIDDLLDQVIPVHDIYSVDPWQLRNISGELCNGDIEQWFFFSPRQEREAHGGRPNRITPAGYWKATGSPGYVYSSNNRVIGLKKTMVFYQGRAPTGRKTKWKVNEYRALEDATPSGAAPRLRSEFSLCRVYVKSGCLRSFDRRPPALTTSDMVAGVENRRMTPDIASSSNLGTSHENLVNEERTSSLESSSSVEHFNRSSIEETSNEDLDSLLDSLDWD